MACRARRSDGDLVRVSLGADGNLVAGRGPGRGVWICPLAPCLERATKADALSRGLKRPVVVVPEDLERVVMSAKRAEGGSER